VSRQPMGTMRGGAGSGTGRRGPRRRRNQSCGNQQSQSCPKRGHAQGHLTENSIPGSCLDLNGAKQMTATLKFLDAATCLTNVTAPEADS
jgi:hypothetical protein